MKRDKYDATISDLIRCRANWTCECCGRISPEGQATGKDRSMHCSHFTSRGAGNIARYDTDAISCHCATCHKLFTDKPYEHTEWFKKHYGESFYDIIREKHNRVRKMIKSEKEEMHQYYRGELNRVKQLRMEGIPGFIETVSYF